MASVTSIKLKTQLREALDLGRRLDHKPSLSQAHMFCAETFIILNRSNVAAACI